MRKICLVTNYNYAKYLGDCLASITAQTRQFDSIVVVDDGSTDGSREIIDGFCRDCSYAQTVYKDNGGQLSCFHSVLEFIGPDDFVFFLDADDSYPADYLEKLSPFIAEKNADFIFVKPIQFMDGEQKTLQSAQIGPEKTFIFPSTSALTRKTKCFIGAATSCLCIKGSLYHELLPYPHEKDWSTRADDVLIFGASIIGASKLYVESLGINYRIHAANNFTGKQLTPAERAAWRLRHERLFTWYSAKAGVPSLPPIKNALHEAALIPGAIRKLFGIRSPAVLFLYDILIGVPIIRLILRDMAGYK